MACCLLVGLGLVLGLRIDLVCGWLVVMHTARICTTFDCHCHTAAVVRALELGL